MSLSMSKELRSSSLNEDTTFSLPKYIVEKYKQLDEPFGFNGLGSFVYKRTYSRVKPDGCNECWAETVERVVNGTYSMQKAHVIGKGLGWDEEKATKSAIEMYDCIFNMRFTPPGRGLWAMGSKITEDKGIFAALNNCSFVSTKDVKNEKSKPFRFLMDMSMLGVGCGFDVAGAGTCLIQNLRKFKELEVNDPDVVITYKRNLGKEEQVYSYVSLLNELIEEAKTKLNQLDENDWGRGPIMSDIEMYEKELEWVESTDLRSIQTFCIEDTREGWVESIGRILDTYFNGEYPIIFDYSKIREAGLPLKTFGGLSSGPVPLIDLHIMTRVVMNRNIGTMITERTIVDIMNLIGKCVVAGNVRRSSEIALGPLDSQEFIDLKNYQKHPDRMSYGWCSNNSIYGVVGMDYSDIAKRIADNGEPGIFWLDTARAYSRLIDPPDNKDHRSLGTNPCCFAGDTLIAVADGRHAVRIDELAEKGDDVPVWAWNWLEDKPVIKWARVPHKTGENVKVMKITLDDGSSITVTPDHLMMLTGGSYIHAAKLKPGDSLQRFDKKVISRGDYYRIKHDSKIIREHVEIGKFYNKEKYDEMLKIYEGGDDEGLRPIFHHIDHNKYNNDPVNLMLTTLREHSSHHSEGTSNPMYGKKHSDETKALIGAKTTERYTDEEYAAKHKASYSDDVKEKLGEKMILQKRELDSQYYIEQEEIAKQTGIKTVWETSAKSNNPVLKAVLNCETCNVEMTVDWRNRNTSYCSHKCQNKDPKRIAERNAGQLKYFEDKQQGTRHAQIMAFNELKDSLGRQPLKKEWEDKCRNEKISFRLNKNATNQYAFKNFHELIEAADGYNHKVVSVEELEKKMDVYNLTVEEFHTLAVVTKTIDGEYPSWSGVFVRNSEQTLESYELCCLCEVYPSRHETKEDFLRTLKFAYLYAKSVTLGDSHWVETNRVMMRNRRIGCSVTGLVQFIAKHNIDTLRDWLTDGYNEIQRWDKIYSEYLAIPRSVKTTSVKPSGCVIPSTKIVVGDSNSTEHVQVLTMNQLFEDCGVDLKKCAKEKVTKQWFEPSMKTWALTKDNLMEEITKLYVNGEVDCYEIPLEDGTKITCTGDHKFLVVRGDSEEWVRADALQEGDDIKTV